MGQEWHRAKAAGLWSWSPDQWAWTADNVRWSLELGMPKTPVFFDVSTDPFPAEDRYEMWRNLLYYSFEGDPLPPEAARAFCARTQCLITDPVQLLHYRSSAVSGRGLPADKAKDRETYTLGVVIAGERRYEQEGARPVVSRAGEFFVFDNRWHSRVEWSDHSAVQISVPRADLEQRIGRTIPEPAEMMRVLEEARIGQVLKGQIQLAARHMADTQDQEREFLLVQLMQLALFACETATATLPARTPPRRDLLSAARSIIEQNIGRSGFDARALLTQLGCSRATLYRAFAEAGTSVSDMITQLRIDRAKMLLEGAPDMPVNIVAARCGWYDGASFARAFRRQAGLSPSEFRERARIAGNA
ncbi:AraC family transcriptional regulator [Erythrobacter colymbi]|uniref:AraC family transcriptional regulator n=1 Tax=Erythrobacter colymbi TaxID=1161202 RepID=UPI000A3C33F9|nr:AraC family transcriptional regulator [Erythrobacter colymbi]